MGVVEIGSDWINLLPGTVVRSLWSGLHDAELLSIQSDKLTRQAVVKFDMPHLRAFHHLRENLRFRFEFDETLSLRASTFVHWPGPFYIPEGTEREEQSIMIAGYRAKGCEESISWKELERSLDPAKLDVYDAWLASGDLGITLRIEGSIVGGDQFYTLFFRGKKLSAQRSDSLPFSLDQLMELGEAYWKEAGLKAKGKSVSARKS